MEMVRVRAKVEHTDATDRTPRAPGEVYPMEAERARKKARDGFVDLIDANGGVIAPDAPELPVMDVVIAGVEEGTARAYAAGAPAPEAPEVHEVRAPKKGAAAKKGAKRA